MFSHATRTGAALLAALPCLALAAPPGQTLLDEVEQAYQETRQYQATARLAVERDQGRWHSREWAEVPIAFDREQERLLVDKPEFTLVIDDRIRLRSEQIRGNHLELETPDDLTYTTLQEAVPFLAGPPLIDVAFLLSDDPVATITGGASGAATTLPPAEDDTEDRPRLQIPTTEAVYTLWIDPESKLIERAIVEPPESALPPGESMRFIYDYEVRSRNEPLPADTFAFDTEGSTPQPSVEAYIGSAAAAAGGAGGAGASAGGGHALVGQDAPPIEQPTVSGEPFKLSETDADVVVLDFWATWCPPCRRGLPELQKVAEWAEAEGKSVLVATVNVGETKEQAQQYFEENNLSMPIILDPQSEVSAAYGVRGIPQTVIIAGGKVAQVHVGFTPGIAETLKTEINEALENTP